MGIKYDCAKGKLFQSEFPMPRKNSLNEEFTGEKFEIIPGDAALNVYEMMAFLAGSKEEEHVQEGSAGSEMFGTFEKREG